MPPLRLYADAGNDLTLQQILDSDVWLEFPYEVLANHDILFVTLAATGQWVARCAISRQFIWVIPTDLIVDSSLVILGEGRPFRRGTGGSEVGAVGISLTTFNWTAMPKWARMWNGFSRFGGVSVAVRAFTRIIPIIPQWEMTSYHATREVSPPSRRDAGGRGLSRSDRRHLGPVRQDDMQGVIPIALGEQSRLNLPPAPSRHAPAPPPAAVAGPAWPNPCPRPCA